jgi:hypothetical protein
LFRSLNDYNVENFIDLTQQAEENSTL